MVGCDVKIRVKIRLPALIAGLRRVPTEVGLLLLLRRLYRASSFVLPTDVGLSFVSRRLEFRQSRLFRRNLLRAPPLGAPRR